MKKILIYILIIPVMAFCQEKINAAVLDFTGIGVSENEAKVLTTYFRNDLVGTGAFTVLDRANMERILSEQSFQQSGCTESECAVQIGRMLNMQYMVVGTLSKFGAKYIFSTELISVETSQIVMTKQGTSDSLEGILNTSKEITAEFGDSFGGRKAEIKKEKEKEPKPDKKKKEKKEPEVKEEKEKEKEPAEKEKKPEKKKPKKAKPARKSPLKAILGISGGATLSGGLVTGLLLIGAKKDYQAAYDEYLAYTPTSQTTGAIDFQNYHSDIDSKSGKANALATTTVITLSAGSVMTFLSVILPSKKGGNALIIPEVGSKRTGLTWIRQF